MAKSESFNNPLIPIVLIAGILSGSLWRGSQPGETGKSGDSGSGAAKAEAPFLPAPWVSDLRPVLESLDGALGARAGSEGTPLTAGATAVTLEPKGDKRDRQIFDAMAGLRTGLDRLTGQTGSFGGDASPLQEHANVLAASMLADDGGEGKTRAAEARALLDEFRDWRLLEALATRVKKSHDNNERPTYSVDFIVETIPDYVDSNSGWTADQALAATQSGLALQGYLFDRMRLIDWSRAAAGSVAVLSASRLHERQPGAIIFRRVSGQEVSLRVVLTVLETPTAGVHQIALRNSLRFLLSWNALCGRGADVPLRVLGPSFSGSTVSLAMVLGEAPFRPFRRIVISGSANADENIDTMRMFSNGAIFRATVQPTSVLKESMAAYLESINSRWKDGEGVALLNESNTAYGTSKPATAAHPTGEVPSEGTFAKARIFNFPLHIAQLRSDAPSLSQPGTALLSGPVIPLNLRESTPPSDVIPALHPQLTGPIVEATVDSILDAIRHEKISAVGIVATDDRDVLFLAREVKRASPDVQLLLFGTHDLYLHPDFVPYLRGTLVASSYGLTLANQPEIPGTEIPQTFDPEHRQPFPSMAAEGLFYAADALVSLPETAGADEDSVPYCRDLHAKNCVPVAPASINVIGEDGYWTLRDASDIHKASTEVRAALGEAVLRAGGGNAPQVPKPRGLYVAPLPPMPVQFLIGVLLVLAVVVAHLGIMFRIRQVVGRQNAGRSFIEWPLVRVLVPPRTFDYAAGLHRFATTMCFAMLSLAAAWVVAVALPFVPGSAASVVPFATFATFGAVFYAGVTSYGPRQRLPQELFAQRDAGPRPNRTLMEWMRAVASRLGSLTAAEWTAWLVFVGMVATMSCFLALVVETARVSAAEGPGRLTLARIVGGGIVSPAALTVFLAASFYTAVFTGVRRLSLVGFGYGRLAGRSPAFGLFTAEREQPPGEPARGSLAAMLDMPAQNMPALYPAAVILFLVVAAISTKRVTTIDGPIFSWFVIVGTWTTLGLGLLQLAQGLALWSAARSHLKRLAHTPIEKHLPEIAPHVPWDISLAPPRLTELMPVARMADSVLRDLRSLAFAGRRGAGGREIPRGLGDILSLTGDEEKRLGVRPADLASLTPLVAIPTHVDALETEMAAREHAAIIQSTTWFDLWRLSDALVEMMQRSAWKRSTTIPAKAARQLVEVVMNPPLAMTGPMTSLANPAPQDHSDPPQRERSGGSPSGWLARCEQLVALQIAFILRDIVARTITCLFAAMVCLTSLTAAHLLYVFSGRASLLLVDMLAVAATALGAIWILVDMERDHVLSRLRTTTPGRVDINWEFIKRIGVYGVLPLLAVIASLFPEIGGTLFGWLEPLRKLSSF
jgi:hypothetical protein